MSHVRCRRCGARRTLAKHPDTYMPGRAPRCRGGGCRSREYRVDHYRQRHEVGKHAPKPCRCLGYSFPHYRGRGWCDHNPALTADDMAERQRYA